MLSVIIPTRDRPRALRACLEALVAQRAAADELEVIVVDDGGRTPADQVAMAFAARLSVRWHRQPNAGPAMARNAGAQLATGDRLAFLDDDCQVTPNWLVCLQERCRRHPDAMIGGASLNAVAENPYAASSQLVHDYLYWRFNSVPEAAQFCASNNLTVPAGAFRVLGGFDPGFRYAAGEDRELCRRWRQSGRPLVYAPEVCVRHGHAMTARSFWRQHFRYGRGARRFHRIGGERQPEKRAGEQLGFYLALLLFPLRRADGPRSVVPFLLVLMSQVAVACGYAAEMLSDRAPERRRTRTVDWLAGAVLRSPLAESFGREWRPSRGSGRRGRE